MPAFFISLLVCALVTLAGREGVRVARLAGAWNAIGGIAVVTVASAVLSSAFAGWLGATLAPALPGAAKAIFTAIALVFAALEVAFLRAGPAPKEPTRSLGATFLALLASQITDAARFVTIALAVTLAAPALAAAGGAAGSGAALVLAAMAGRQWEARVPLAALRIAVAAALSLAALVIGLSALHLL